MTVRGAQGASMMTIRIEVKAIDGTYEGKVQCHVQHDDAPFIELMCAAEYLCAIVAAQSDLGFEKALEKLHEGAMSWRGKAVTEVWDEEKPK